MSNYQEKGQESDKKSKATDRVDKHDSKDKSKLADLNGEAKKAKK